jgi:hypothetical protein
MSDELVEIWRQPDGSWRWRYLVVDDHQELRANRGYDSLEDAVLSARRAYPGVHVLTAADHPESLDGTSRRGRGMMRIIVASALAVFAALALWGSLRQARREMSRRR